MKTELSRLSYDFSLRSSEGGLETLRFQFMLPPGEDEDAPRSIAEFDRTLAIDRDANHYRAMLKGG